MANEHMHTRACLGHNMITVIQNWVSDTSITDHEFRLHAQNNGILQEADSYLDWTQVGIEAARAVCLPECGASAYNYMWDWAHNLDHNDPNKVNEWFDEARRLLRPMATGRPIDISPEYNYTRLFRWVYDFWAEQEHNETLFNTTEAETQWEG